MDSEDFGAVAIIAILALLLIVPLGGYMIFDHMSMNDCVAAGKQWVEGNCINR